MKTFNLCYDNGISVLKTAMRGHLILDAPCLNKGTAFSHPEREALGLTGLLPFAEETLELQITRCYRSYLEKNTDLERHIFLRALQDSNEVLYYGFLKEHIVEMLPIIYTPVVGKACQEFHKIYRKSRGLYLSYPHRERIDRILDHIDLPDVKIIVVSDGERILGLGDQGAGGMGIPIGKISLYSACGGLYPGYGLPILLDVGTDNEERLKDPLYLGWRHPRVRGGAYEEFVDTFVKAVMRKFPRVLLQWEDFAKDHARLFLDRYRNQLCTFNDDIQGTASVALAGILAGVKIAGGLLGQQNIVIYGAGSAGTGIADQIVAAMVHQGLDYHTACRRIYLIDIYGLIHSKSERITVAQQPYVHPLENFKTWQRPQEELISFKEVMFHLHPSVLIGVSACPGAFTEEIVRAMAKNTPRPLIFPLSNPHERCEAKPEDLICWTEGRAIIATGTPFPEVRYREKVFKIDQCNNFYIFPAVGLAVLASKATRLTNQMFLVAAEALSGLSPALQTKGGSLFPDPRHIEMVSKTIALAVALQAQKEGVAAHMPMEKLKENIHNNYWQPVYSPVIAC